MQDTKTGTKKEFSCRRMMIRSFISIIAIGVAIFALAGRLDYWQGWLFFSILLIFMTGFGVFFTKKQDLMQERVGPGSGVKWWDKIFFAIHVPLSFSVSLLAALDAGRFHWSPQLPIVLYPVTFVLILAGCCIIYWAMWTNNFFSSRVRIQTDRGHYVVTEGPYHYVRHPGYVGLIIFMPALALLLGSIYALIPAAIDIFLLIIRTYLEDITLQKELPGYTDYTKQVRFRLIPCIW
ncbi:MAG: isoprenylcysteine carboxylmethyltransferase family protein [Sedimentisphaerales bacterium]